MAPSVCTQKFGAPLYAGTFLTEELLVLGGGGGKKSSGIPNRCGGCSAAGPCAAPLPVVAPLLTACCPCRLLVAKWADGVLSAEPVFTHVTGDAPPERCVLPRRALPQT
jgi:hypothetical protein